MQTVTPIPSTSFVVAMRARHTSVRGQNCSKQRHAGLLRLLVCSAFPCLLLFCAPLAAGSEVALSVSESHHKDLLPLTKRDYKESELDSLFEQMRQKSDPFCRMIWRQTRFDEKIAGQFIEKSVMKSYRTSCPKCLPSIKAGCNNFFAMNDLEPDRDFRLVRKLYPQEKLDCYSVGFLQPYIMHGVMKCQSLTMVDIDWRLMDGHLQMIRKYRDQAFATLESAKKAVSSLDVGWVALSYDMRPKNRVNTGFFCQRHKQERSCPFYFRVGQAAFSQLQRIKMSISALHDETYRTGEPDAVKVIYFSNALEKDYTNEKQFQVLMANLKAGMAENSKTVMIHHVGGYRLFGLYEVTKRSGNLQMKTICRDVYLMPDRSRYSSHMEKMTRSRRAPLCYKLVRKHGLDQRPN